MDERQALRYLDRIGFFSSGPWACEGDATKTTLPPPTYETLERLVLKHLMAIPFENLDLHARGHPFEVTPEESERKELLSVTPSDLHEKIVASRRGGICFEANHAFHFLLKIIGYDVTMQLCNVLTPLGYAPVPNHVNNIVRLDDKFYVAEVAFGQGAECPLPLPTKENPQHLVETLTPAGERWRFDVVETPDADGNVWMYLQKFNARKQEWEVKQRYDFPIRPIPDIHAMRPAISMVQTSNMSPFLAKSLATKLVPYDEFRTALASSGVINEDEIPEATEGHQYVRITLTGSQLVVTELPKGFRITKELDEEAEGGEEEGLTTRIERVLTKMFGFNLPESKLKGIVASIRQLKARPSMAWTQF